MRGHISPTTSHLQPRHTLFYGQGIVLHKPVVQKVRLLAPLAFDMVPTGLHIGLLGRPSHVPWANAKLPVALVVHNALVMWGWAMVQVAEEPVKCKIQVV